MFDVRSSDERVADYDPTVPRIVVYRDEQAGHAMASQSAALARSPAVELSYFAHELGHHLSYRRGTYCVFDEASPVATYTEEVRAWELGRAVLEIGRFAEWDVFNQVQRDRLEGYARGLSVSEDVHLVALAEVRREMTAIPVKPFGRPTWYRAE